VIIHDVEQRTKDWFSLREKHCTASNAPAILGMSKYVTRKNAVLIAKGEMKRKEIYPPLARDGDIAERRIIQHVSDTEGVELFSPTITNVIDGLNLLASMDGLSMDMGVAVEAKLWNKGLAESLLTGDVPDNNWPQLEHQMLVIDVKSMLFGCAEPFNGGQIRIIRYESQKSRRAMLIHGWKRFLKEVSNSHE